MKKMLAAAFALAVLLTGCGDPEISAIETTTTVTVPPVTVTEEAPPVTVTVEPTEEVDTSALEEELGDNLMNDPELQRAALDVTWSGMSETDKLDICSAWELAELRPMLLEQFQFSSDYLFDEGLVEDYFNEVCL